MLTPEYLEECAEVLLGMYDALNTAIIMDVAKRIVKMGRVSEASEIQIMKLQECGLVYEDAIERITSITGHSDKELKRMFQEAGITSVKNENDICTKYGAPEINLKQSDNMIKILSAGLEKTKGAVNNLTLTTANMAQDMYINACDKAYLKVVNGLTSFDQAVKDAVVEAAVQGNYVRYPSGHKDRLDVAIRRSVITGVNQTMAQINLAYCDEIGTDLVETTAHSGARPTHEVWQGQIFSRSGKSDKYEEFESATGYGTGDGICGWNCSHNFHAYIEGMPRTYTEEMLEDYKAAKYEYDGRKYTDYECKQMMRAQERKIRQTKRSLAGLNAGMEEAASGTLKKSLMDEFEKKAVLLKQQEAKLKDICAKTNRYYQSARTQVSAVLSDSGKIVGFNKSVSQKAVWANKNYIAKYSGYRYNKDGTIKVTDDWTHRGKVSIPKKFKSHAIIETVETKRGIQYKNRTIYDKEGKLFKQIHSGNHGNPKQHPFGEHGEHKHIFYWENGKIKSKDKGNLDSMERKENRDIL